MKTIKKVSEVYTGGTPIVSTITSSSTNSEIAGAKAVYDAIPRGIICCKRDAEWINPSSNSYNKVDLELRDCVGTTFSFDTTNYVINVLKNCKALVSATSIIASASGHQTYFRIRKNGDGDIFTIVQNISSNNYLVAFSDILVDLEAGDYIELCYYGNQGDRLSAFRTNITVTEIAN